jgi:hypothetical protein
VWSTNRADLMLLGFRDADLALDVERLDRRIRRPDFHSILERLGIVDLPMLLAHEAMPLGVVNAAALRGPIHSLYHPRLNFEAGRAFFVGHQGELPFTGYGEPAEVGAANSLVRRLVARSNGDGVVAIQRDVASHSCYERLPGCGAYVGWWAGAKPGTEEFQTLSDTLNQRNGPLFVRRMRYLANERTTHLTNRIRPEAALEMTQLYMKEYAHGAPLDPSALLEFWQRCGLNPVGQTNCRPGLRAAQHLMIGDEPPAPEDWLNPDAEAAAVARAQNPQSADEPEPHGGDDL